MTKKKEQLEAAGWKVGTAEEFLALSLEESRLVEAQLAAGEREKRKSPND